MQRVILLTILIVTQVACASTRPPGVFTDGGPFHANTLRLRPDGTFTYEAWSDDGGAFWRAEGAWKWVARDRFTTEIANVTLGGQIKCGPLKQFETWRVTGRGVVRDTPVFAPKGHGG